MQIFHTNILCKNIHYQSGEIRNNFIPLQPSNHATMSNEKVATFANKTIVTNDMAPALRQNATKAEAILWRCLRDRRMGVKFRRQCPVGDYILDFYCHSLKLCIELDGGVHGEYGAYQIP